MKRRWITIAALLLLRAACLPQLPAADLTLEVDTPMAPPGWALLERELLRANSDACEEFFQRYFDERGFLLCVERWGGDDGPDDAIENCNDWPILHALGASDRVLEMYKTAWEGHLRQYTLAKTVEVPFARDGMYYKEFPVMFDWVHNGEGLTVFNLQGLSDPNDGPFRQRVRRFAGFYLNEDPGAPNYDPEQRIIRSMFNGSRGPLLRKATGLDWAGDPIEVKNRFHLGHGEESYRQMLEHFEDYNDIVGDHPQNLLATSLAMNAYMLTHEEKYRSWILEYVDAWRERMEANGGIIPTNIGLDGAIGGEADGRWYGGVYGWGFSVRVPQTGEWAHRNTHQLGFVGFMNAYMLTADDRYLDAWRKQADVINVQMKIVGGRPMYPRMYGELGGDDVNEAGWYDFVPSRYTAGAREIYYLTMDRDDLRRVPYDGWLAFLDGDNPDYPEQTIRGDIERVRNRVADMREDTTTPDTRLADDPMRLNPASVNSLIGLMLGGLHPGHRGAILNCRVRYFDPMARRAGIPEDVAALVERLTADEVTLTLINVNQVEPREAVIQAGGYGEHQFQSVSQGDQTQPIDGNDVRVRLAPGSGSRLTFKMDRYANPPTLLMPWDRG